MTEKKKSKLNLIEFTKVIAWTFKIYWGISPFNTVSLIITRAITQSKGLLYAFFFGKVIDSVMKISQMQVPDYKILAPYLIALLIYRFIFDGLIDSLATYSRRYFRIISRSEVDRMLFVHLNKIGVQTLEDPKVNNLLQRSQQWIYDMYGMLEETVSLISETIGAIASGVVIYTFFPAMIPILIVVTLIKFLPDRYFTSKDFHWQVDNTERRRMAFNYSSWLSSVNALQEISIIGSYEYFQKKYNDFFSWYNKGALKIMTQRQTSTFFLNTLDTIVSTGGYLVLFATFITHKITIGTLSFQMKALDSFSDFMSGMLSELSFMNEYTAKMNDVVELFKITSAFPDGDRELPQLKTPPAIEFKNVSFSYPQSEKVIISDLNLHIKSGEKIAIVGHNGAGKTTLVKLLSRMYIPTAGTIEVNDIPLVDIKTSDWYKNIGVLFQDYNFYNHMTPRENIFVGNSHTELDENRMLEASQNADAHNFIMEFPKQYDQILSERFEGGIRPSSGQQQKISIARFFYRNSPLVIFDEPTAAIDAVSEYNIFNKIYDFFKNKTVVIISHRFSTVRNADRIIVMEKGAIIEEGSHEQLIALNGVYANAFRLQAEGYQDKEVHLK